MIPEEQADRLVGSWLHQSIDALPAHPEFHEHWLESLPAVEQRRGRWLMWRSTASPPTTPTQPRPDRNGPVWLTSPASVTHRSRPALGLGLLMGASLAVALTIVLVVAQSVWRQGDRVPGTGSDEAVLPPATGPAGNGLIAYASDGDIYVGDPVTGTTTAIVTGPIIDSRPRFSPDGSRIAFIRGDPYTEEKSVIVVAADGSDERVAMPAGYSRRGTDLTWTPDGTSILANVDVAPFTTPYFDGELALLDPAGVAEPRLITPPLPRGPGGSYFRYTDQVAPMFRPPGGEAILTTAELGAGAGPPASSSPLLSWDAALEQRMSLIPQALDPFEPYFFQPWALWWSPDGSRIAFTLGWSDDDVQFGLFVMDADGSDVSMLEVDGNPVAWSPDGTRMAVQRCLTRPDGADGADIIIVHLASGSERVLEATSVETKQEGRALPGATATEGQPMCGWYDGPEGRAWDYEGWTWSPDGRAIVLLERAGTRPLVVDVETGSATELPWASDSAPSWQRVASD